MILLIVPLFLSGCYTVHFVTGAGSEYKDKVITRRMHFFLWGLVEEKDVNVARACRTGVYSFEERFTAGDALFGILSLGLYTPRTVTVICLKEPEQEGEK